MGKARLPISLPEQKAPKKAPHVAKRRPPRQLEPREVLKMAKLIEQRTALARRMVVDRYGPPQQHAVCEIVQILCTGEGYEERAVQLWSRIQDLAYRRLEVLDTEMRALGVRPPGKS